MTASPRPEYAALHAADARSNLVRIVHGPIRLTVATDNLAALARYRGPLLVLHGRDDAIVPIAHGRLLAAAVPGAILQELPCGHNDCPRDWQTIDAFLRGVVGP